MAKFTLVVTCSIEKSYTAYSFAMTAIGMGHEFPAIFFFKNGTSCANGLVDLPNDEPNIQAQWQRLALEYNIELVACAASAIRRGITEKHLQPGFKFGSIAQILLACNSADQVVQF